MARGRNNLKFYLDDFYQMLFTIISFWKIGFYVFSNIAMVPQLSYFFDENLFKIHFKYLLKEKIQILVISWLTDKYGPVCHIKG